MRGYRLRFFPTNLSRTLWVYPQDRDEDLDLLASILRPGETYVDVGANIGFTAIEAKRAVGPAGHVYAIEPHPTIYSYLVKNLALNGYGVVKTINSAAGRQPGALAFSNLRQDDMNFLRPDGQVTVKVETLDRLLDGSGPVDLLKVDVEGAEMEVFAGAEQTLSRTQRIYFEVSAQNLQRFGSRVDELLSEIINHQFKLFQLIDGQLKRVECEGDVQWGSHAANIIAARDLSLLQDRLKVARADA